MNGDRHREFLWGFARGAGLDIAEADEQWAGFSRQLSERDREAIEIQGEDSGFEQGQAFRRLYPA